VSIRRIVLRLVNVVRRGTAERDLAREIASHLGMLEDGFRQRGMTAAEARRAARLALGGVEQTKERQRDARSFVWLDDARRDLAHSARLLRRSPAFALTAVLSLAIGIGANTAIFTVANALLFRDPPGVGEPDRLVDIGVSREFGGFNPGSYPMYLDVRERATTLTDVYARVMFPHAKSFAPPGTSRSVERAFAFEVTTNYFTALRATPSAGRLFDESDGDRGPVAVVSHRFWTRRFNKDPDIVGRTVRVNGQPFVVAGVASEGFQGTGVVAPDLWLPLTVTAGASGARSSLTDRSGGWLIMGGRLEPGVLLPQAAAEVDAIGRALNQEYPASGSRGLRLLRASRVPGNDTVIAVFASVMMIIVSLVLIVACANLAGILLARAAARRREIAVRLAMGAGRARLVRQLLTETVVLFAIGGVAGVVFARVMTSVLVPLLPSPPFPIDVTLALDGRVMLFTIVLSFLAAVLSGLAPALQASRADVVASLNDTVPRRFGRTRLRGAFVVTQIAFSLLLVVTAGLFVRALRQAGSVDPGFDPRGVELASLDLSMAGYTDTTGPRFASDLLDRVRQLGDVQTATLAVVVPGGFEGIGNGVAVPGVTAPDGQRFFNQYWNMVAPGYFATLRIPFVDGRDFTVSENADAERVAIVSEHFARRFWPERNAVGQFILRGVPGPRGVDLPPEPLRVVGVVRDVKSSSLIDGLAESFVYVPFAQRYMPLVTIVARTTRGQRIGDELRALVASMNPGLPVVKSETLDDSMALGLVSQRVAASISGSLGTVGLVLAAIGIYGMAMYMVARRTREIGIRIALGAQRRAIVTMVLRQALWLAVIGSTIGLALAAAASHALSGFLFGVAPLDPPAFIGATVLFAIATLAACYVPVRRATSVDPAVALRHD